VIYGVNGSESLFTPKTFRDRGRYEEGTHNIKNVTKFSFGTTILLRGIGTGIMGKGAIRIQKGEERFIIILLGII
jgi:hypothetical protein